MTNFNNRDASLKVKHPGWEENTHRGKIFQYLYITQKLKNKEQYVIEKKEELETM